ncbi:hypothetical protein SAMN05444336_101998 [Albimonas donghaensis]|uniref:Uncharacterized protein n=1 Tax=Albimonas donghaensis TaxID=356660 RepID=A0A1H2TI28_9RHOB|nr:hypothetical protein [Albimonas donghaensis]SDW43325.1 hypothetical protein SAMN05444336_101998 [Albimonas donghaensis]
MRILRPPLRRLAAPALVALVLAGAAALPGAARACDAGEVRALIGRGFTDAEIDRHCAAAEAKAMAEALAEALGPVAATPSGPEADPSAPSDAAGAGGAGNGTENGSGAGAPAAAACPPTALRGDWVAQLLPETAGGAVAVARLSARDAQALWRVGATGGRPSLALAERRWPIQPEPFPVRLVQGRCEAGVLTLVWEERSEAGAGRMVARVMAPEPGALGGAVAEALAAAEDGQAAASDMTPDTGPDAETVAPAQTDRVWGEYMRERPAGASSAATREFGRLRLTRAAPAAVPATPPTAGRASDPDAPAPAARVIAPIPPSGDAQDPGAATRPGIARLPSIAPPDPAGGLAGLPGFGAGQAMTPAAARERLVQLRAARDMCRSSFAKAMGGAGKADMCAAFDATIAQLERIAGL